MRHTLRGAVASILALSLVMAACTDDGEPPSSTVPVTTPDPGPDAPIGVRVGVVLPPASALDASVLNAVDAQLSERSAATDETVRELRGYAAADPRFVEDVAQWLSEQGTELVCVLGDRAESVAVGMAARYRGIRFCALPTGPPSVGEGDASEPADGVLRVELRVEELGYLVGVVAGVQAGGGSVGLILGGDDLPSDRFRAGLLAGLSGTEVVEADMPSGQEVTLADRASAVIAAEVSVVVIDGAAGATEALEVVGDSAAVLAPMPVLRGSTAVEVVLGWSVRWDLALAGPLASLAGEPAAPEHTSVGFSDDVFAWALGDGALDPVLAVVEQVALELASGTRDPTVPARSPGSDPSG